LLQLVGADEGVKKEPKTTTKKASRKKTAEALEAEETAETDDNHADEADRQQ